MTESALNANGGATVGSGAPLNSGAGVPGERVGVGRVGGAWAGTVDVPGATDGVAAEPHAATRSTTTALITKQVRPSTEVTFDATTPS